MSPTSIATDAIATDGDLEHLLSVLETLKSKPCAVPLIRIGGRREGAHLLPDDLKDIQACFSPGVSDCKIFEDQLSKD